jgi:hypothetical protein
MTYISAETSTHSGKPTELYRFLGTYANFYYTSGQRKVTYQAPDETAPNVYLPIAISRAPITAGTQSDDGLDMDIELAVTNDIVQTYGFQSAPPSLVLTIFRFHSLDEVVSYWQGPVNNIKVDNGVATIRSLSLLSSALLSNLPNVYYQSPCNHILYDERCKVSEAAFKTEANVIAINGRVITLDNAGTLDGKLIGGDFVLASGERRMITAQNGVQVIVNFAFSKINIGDIIAMSAGCDLSYTGDCMIKFNNQINFGGFPFIPSLNPFTTGIDPAAVPLVDTTCVPALPCLPWPVILEFGTGPRQCNLTYAPDLLLTAPPGPYEDAFGEHYYQPNPPETITTPEHPEGFISQGRTFSPSCSRVGLGIGNVGDYYFRETDTRNTEYHDPRLEGQILWQAVMNYHQMNFQYNFVISGAWSCEVQFPGGFCGSVGQTVADFNVSMCATGGMVPNCECLLARVAGGPVDGSFYFDFNWNF